MKKLFISLMAMMLIVSASFSNVFATSQNNGFVKAKAYMNTLEELTSIDQLIAYESLGLESDEFDIEPFISTDYASSIAKSVIAIALHGDDPRQYNGVNYVEMLENCVQETGAVDKANPSTGANYQVYGVYALYAIHSDLTEKAADYLVTLATENGAFGFGSYEDLSVTGWVIEALSLVNKTKYQSTIENAVAWIQSKQIESGEYVGGNWGADANNQASVLNGLLTYDAKGVKDGKYNKGGNNPYDALLKYQFENGSFAWHVGDPKENPMATVQGIQAVGTYENGSAYQRAHETYARLLNPEVPEVQPEEKPIVKPETKPEMDKVEVVPTADTQMPLLYLGLCVISALGLWKGKEILG